MTFLVLCRIENSSKAPAWLTNLGPAAHVEYSTYGDSPEPGIHHYRGGKWTGIFDFFKNNPQTLQAFQFFWFPDDDIVTCADTAVEFMALCQSESFELAQPALSPESYFAYRETIVSPFFRYRKTNFVELMMPCMRRDFLLRALPLFENRHAALGIDWIWQNLASDPRNKVAIADCYPMFHSRPRNTHLAQKMSAQSISIAEEKARTFESLAVPVMTPIVYGGVSRRGRHIGSNLRVSAMLFAGYLNVRSRIANGRWQFKHTRKLVLKQLRFKSANLGHQKTSRRIGHLTSSDERVR